MKYDFIKKIEKHLDERGLYNKEVLLRKYHSRKKQNVFSLNDHIKALIYSQLSNQRSWEGIESNIETIDEIFFHYDQNEIMNKDGVFFADKLKLIKCGNRSINNQMEYLNENIKTLNKISEDYGSVDNFFGLYNDNPIKAAKILSTSGSKYKLNQVGIALALEYMRNVGIDVAKPDTHIRRILGNKRLNLSKNEIAKEIEAVEIVKEISKTQKMTQIEVDYLLWCYCADKKGEICKEIPNCNKCVIRSECNYNS